MAINKIPCPVLDCEKSYNSFLDLAKHMIMTDRPNVMRASGEEIDWLERHLGKEFEHIGWKSDKKIALALKRIWKYNGNRWPD